MFKAGGITLVAVKITLVAGEITLVAGEITLVAGGWGAEAPILLRLAMQTIVGRGSPCHVLQQEVAPPPRRSRGFPLPLMEGSDMPFLFMVCSKFINIEQKSVTL